MGFLGTLLQRLFSAPKRPMLKPGSPAPAFAARDQHGETVRLLDLRGKRVVLWFYPKADTPG